MPNVIAYVCNQEVPKCSPFCRMLLSECRHTFDKTYAKNGAIDSDKVNEYPGRFVKVGTKDNIDYYEEVGP